MSLPEVVAMNYGPELVHALVPELRRWNGCTLQRLEAGGRWCSLAFRAREPLFISWEPEAFGICTAPRSRGLWGAEVKSPFAAALRRYIVGGVLSDVEALPGDRVLRLGFQRFVGGGVAKLSWLIVELTGRMSNAILTDETEVIIEAARHVLPEVNRFRSVAPGGTYVPPPPFSGDFPSVDMSDDALERCLEHPRGIGRPLAASLRELWASDFRLMVRDALFGSNVVFQRLGNYLTAAGVALPGAEVFDGDGLSFCRQYVAGTMERRSLNGVASRAHAALERAAGRRRKHADDLRSQIARAEGCDAYRAAGEALLQNLNRSTTGLERVELNYWDAEGEKSLEVRLNPALDFQGNAKAYFKKYQKFHADVPAVRAKLDALLRELDDIAALEDYLGRVDGVKELEDLCAQIEEEYTPRHLKASAPRRKAKKPAPPHLRFVLSNSLILVGMNERGNRYVTFEAAGPEDLWFHVHEYPGAHVILKNAPADADALDKAIRSAASLALCYSRCGNATAAVDFTQRKQVRHIAGSGPANVTYHRPKSVSVSRDEWRELGATAVSSAR